MQAAYPIVRAAREGGCGAPILVSTTTPTGRDMALRLLGEEALHLFAPFDHPDFVASAVDSIRPALYVTLETEIWPNLLTCLRRRGVPTILANGRVSDRTFRRARTWAPLWRDLLSRLDLLLVRTEEDRRRLLALRVPEARIRVSGDCKVDALFLRRERVDPGAWRERLGPGEGADFLAGSTHEGEEEAVLEAFARVRSRCPGARLILVPRHPERAEGLLPLCEGRGNSCLLSRTRPGWAILLVDRVGVLFELYALARSAFVGGSLVPRGGQNPMEPALLGVPIQHGPHMEDFAAPAAALDASGGAETVRSAGELADAWLRLLPDPGGEARRGRMSVALTSRFEGDRGAARRTWKEIEGRLRANRPKGAEAGRMV